MEKKCKVCDGLFDVNQFAKDSPGKCIPCYKKQRKEHYNNNRERLLKISNDYHASLNDDEKEVVKENRKKYLSQNKNKVSQTKKEYSIKNSDHIKYKRRENYMENREELILKNKAWKAKRSPEQILKDKETRKKYYQENSKRINERRRMWMENPQNKIAHNLRTRIRQSLQLNKSGKAAKTEELTGTSYKELKNYLESKFVFGMSWKNYGEWHIDHIIPINYFDLSVEENQRICFNFRNLQPLWKFDNIRKNDRITITNVEDFIKNIKVVL